MIRIFFGLKPSRDQYGANKKRFSQIGPAVPELLKHRQTDIHTDRQRSYYLRVRIYYSNSFYSWFSKFLVVILRDDLWFIEIDKAVITFKTLATRFIDYHLKTIVKY